MDLYFQRHDGSAVTCDDFRAAMADANGVDLSSLANWYQQVWLNMLICLAHVIMSTLSRCTGFSVRHIELTVIICLVWVSELLFSSVCSTRKGAGIRCFCYQVNSADCY